MFDQLKYQFKNGNTLIKLLIINAGIFIAINVIGIIAFLGGFDWYTAGGGVKQLFLVEYLSANSDVLLNLKRPWTFITYMFTHEDQWHILVNMLIFYYIGSIFMDLLGEKRVLPLYIMGGLSGLLLYLIAFNLLPVFQGGRSPIIGASASVMAVMLATATYVPNYPIRLMLIGQIPLKYIAGFYVLVDLLALRGSANMGGHIAHLGGAIFGFVYAKQLTQGKDIAKYFYLFINLVRGLFVRQPKVKVVHRNKKADKTRTPKSQTTNKTTTNSADKQARIDAILDKISKSGYENLTPEEKDFLFNASKE
ncbi:rhomboid family protein [Luteibaculum oceani]|uniref:Rhomboid family intramembrane serine protease n=1 Tax=Luteibaculum oceani TaxID=1294296 RepID=A0A5C6UZH8_9FLAO|nr:rhomboid family intramembrane serine protease [Luteibaculum oceani]TXC78677.1 rhomboid family intramembrane serine protease [Luteibaculum oceani]